MSQLNDAMVKQSNVHKTGYVTYVPMYVTYVTYNINVVKKTKEFHKLISRISLYKKSPNAHLFYEKKVITHLRVLLFRCDEIVKRKISSLRNFHLTI